MTLFAVCTLLWACGDTGPDGQSNRASDAHDMTGSDAGGDTYTPEVTETESDGVGDTGEEDVPTVGDVEQQEFDHRCDDAPVEEWPLNDAVSDGFLLMTRIHK